MIIYVSSTKSAFQLVENLQPKHEILLLYGFEPSFLLTNKNNVYVTLKASYRTK